MVCRTQDIPRPGFTVPRRVLDKLFTDALIQTHSPSELAKEAMRREVTAGGEKRAEEIRKAEEGMEYPQVSGLCRVIDSDTRRVVIDPGLVEALRRRERVGYRQLLLYSVQIWTSKIVNLPVKPVFSSRARANNADTLYAWDAAYDPDFWATWLASYPCWRDCKRVVSLPSGEERCTTIQS